MKRAGGAYGTHICDLEVDPETGKTDVIRYTIVQDAGRAIHPSYVEGQMQGGVAQGIGWALNEEYYMSDDGVMSNSSYLDYRMPTSLDLPSIETVIVEVPNPGSPVRCPRRRRSPDRPAGPGSWQRPQGRHRHPVAGDPDERRTHRRRARVGERFVASRRHYDWHTPPANCRGSFNSGIIKL